MLFLINILVLVMKTEQINDLKPKKSFIIGEYILFFTFVSNLRKEDPRPSLSTLEVAV